MQFYYFLTLSRSLHFCGFKTENIINNYYWVNTLLFYSSLRYTIHDPVNTESMPHWGVSPKAKRVRTLDPIPPHLTPRNSTNPRQSLRREVDLVPRTGPTLLTAPFRAQAKVVHRNLAICLQASLQLRRAVPPTKSLDLGNAICTYCPCR